MIHRLTLALATLIAALGAPLAASEITNLTTDERAAFGEEVRSYLMQNPDILWEMMTLLEQRKAETQLADDTNLITVNAEALFNDGVSHVAGNPDGDITIVEFVDYNCGYCRKAFPEVKELVSQDGNIRLVLKEFPILGEKSVLASRFAISTQVLLGEDAYGALHDAMMTMRGNISEDSLVTLADGLDLDGTAILAAMNDPAVDSLIGDNHALAQRMQVSGTPSFVIGGQMARGYLPLKDMQTIVAEEREALDG